LDIYDIRRTVWFGVRKSHIIPKDAVEIDLVVHKQWVPQKLMYQPITASSISILSREFLLSQFSTYNAS